MTQIPAGWYPDPDPQAPEPKGQRYWDGQQWTEHVQPAPGQPVPAPPQLGQSMPGQGPGFSQAYAPMSPYAGGVSVARATTPDGQELAGWWVRVAAYLIDGFIVGILGAIVAAPWIGRLVDAYTDFFSAALDAAESGSTTVPGQADFLAEIAGPLLVVTFIGLAVSLAYNSLFLRWKAATPGKLLLGLRIRLREAPGQLSWGTILKRWFGQFGYALLSVVPVLGSIIGLYPLLDGLWPLWDSRKQAIHDKIAATNVVKQRGDTWTPGQPA